MDPWLARFAEGLKGAMLRAEPGAQLPPDAANRILRLAREIAHGTERKNAPLATFLIGRYVAVRAAEGATVERALDEATAVARELLPPDGGGSGEEA